MADTWRVWNVYISKAGLVEDGSSLPAQCGGYVLVMGIKLYYWARYHGGTVHALTMCTTNSQSLMNVEIIFTGVLMISFNTCMFHRSMEISMYFWPCCLLYAVTYNVILAITWFIVDVFDNTTMTIIWVQNLAERAQTFPAWQSRIYFVILSSQSIESFQVIAWTSKWTRCRLWS